MVGRPVESLRLRAGIATVAVVALVVVVYGGYGRHWPWTGINGHSATLWEWLHLLLLPVVVSLLPLWVSRRTRVDRATKSAGLTALGVFTAVVLAGYLIPWAWTGFEGNTLWDWLNLIALPVALALTPAYTEIRAAWNRRHTVIALAALAVFALIVAGGYLEDWRWTGFTGNKLWQWLHLLLLPTLLPVVVIPALKPRALAHLTMLEQEPEGGTRDDAAAPQGAADDDAAGGDAAGGDAPGDDSAASGAPAPAPAPAVGPATSPRASRS